MSETVNWSGYAFGVYQKDSNWSAAGGVYIFCGITPQNQWRPYYIGQADQFRNRLTNHDRWEEAARLGATHVHAMVVEQEAMRDAIEKSLIATYKPTPAMAGGVSNRIWTVQDLIAA